MIQKKVKAYTVFFAVTLAAGILVCAEWMTPSTAKSQPDGLLQTLKAWPPHHTNLGNMIFGKSRHRSISYTAPVTLYTRKAIPYTRPVIRYARPGIHRWRQGSGVTLATPQERSATGQLGSMEKAAREHAIPTTRRGWLLATSWLAGTTFMRLPTGRTEAATSETAEMKEVARLLIDADQSSSTEQVEQDGLQQPLRLFEAKAGFTFECPPGWVASINRPGGVGDVLMGASTGDGAETLAVVGDFKKADTVSVRRQPLDTRLGFLDDTKVAPPTGSGLADLSMKVAKVVTEFERNIAWASKNGAVPGNVEFELGVTSASELNGKPYFSYEYYTAVDQGQIVKRRHIGVATASKGYLYILKASTADSRWSKVKPLLEKIARSFKINNS